MSLRQVSEGAFFTSLQHHSHTHLQQQHPTPSPTPQKRGKILEIPGQFFSNWWHSLELFLVPDYSECWGPDHSPWHRQLVRVRNCAALQCQDTEPQPGGQCHASSTACASTSALAAQGTSAPIPQPKSKTWK